MIAQKQVIFNRYPKNIAALAKYANDSIAGTLVKDPSRKARALHNELNVMELPI